MNYYENVVIDYLRADRAVFVNTEYCIQINEKKNPDRSGPHWYCDAVVINFRSKEIFLREISYAVHLADMVKRLKGWNQNWDGVCIAIKRDSLFGSLFESWKIRPWLFIPEKRTPFLKQQMERIGEPLKFDPKITPLEDVQPWRYPNFGMNARDQNSE